MVLSAFPIVFPTLVDKPSNWRNQCVSAPPQVYPHARPRILAVLLRSSPALWTTAVQNLVRAADQRSHAWGQACGWVWMNPHFLWAARPQSVDSLWTQNDCPQGPPIYAQLAPQLLHRRKPGLTCRNAGFPQFPQPLLLLRHLSLRRGSKRLHQGVRALKLRHGTLVRRAGAVSFHALPVECRTVSISRRVSLDSPGTRGDATA